MNNKRTVIIEQLPLPRKEHLFKVHFVEGSHTLGHWPVDESGLAVLIINWIVSGVRPQ